MSLLRDRIRIAVEETKSPEGLYNFQGACERVITTLDDEELRNCARRDIIRQARTVSRARAPERERRYPLVYSLFPGLDDAYPLGADEAAPTKVTEELTWDDFRALVAIREEQFTADKDRLNYHKRTLRLAEPIWQKHPDWVFGQVCVALGRAPAIAA